MTTSHAPDRWGRRASFVVSAAASLVLTACGGSAATSDDPPAASLSPSAALARPEGAWTLVAWTIKRSDSAVPQRMARTLLGTFDPACPSGPCDVTFAPTGVNGTFRDTEVAPVAGGSPTTSPLKFTWDGTTYAATSAERVVSCTTKDGTTVTDGYVLMTRLALTFVLPSGPTPARVHGTIEHTTKGTAASRPKGCTDYLETEAVGGVPTGALDGRTVPNGVYGASITTTATTPKNLATVGSSLWLGTMSAAGGEAAPTITGLTTSIGALTQTGTGWSAAPPSAATDCLAVSGQPVAKGADGVEAFEDLRAVALTAQAKPIFGGVWRTRLNPNATGLKAACSLAVYEGRLLLVPDGAGP